MTAVDPPVPQGSLSVTALYTAGAWAWSDRPGAALYASTATQRVFGTVNGVLRIASWFVRDAPSLRHGLVQRHVMLDAVTREAIEKGAGAILELAAGLSPRGAAFSAQPSVSWTEVDLPPVVAYKTELLARSPAGREVLARPNLVRVAADLRDADLRALVSPQGPMVVLAEGLLMYLDDDARADLFARVRDLLRPHGGTFAFDLVPPAEKPRPGFIARLLGGWMRRFTGGEGLSEAPTTTDDVLAMLRDAGFGDVRSLLPADAPARWAVPHLDQRTEQRLFVAIAPPTEGP